MDENNLMPFLLVTANVGSVFEDPTRLLKIWMKEFLSHVAKLKPKFIALHLQEVGGKTYEKSMEYVQDFIQTICESNEFQEFNRIRIYLDEDYNSAEHFTALGNLYFAHKTINMLEMWDFHAHDWAPVEGISIHTGNIECVTSKEKAKFPQNFFPECRWSRKGFLRTRWNINGTVLDLVNIHLFHDASNLAACETFPSVYCKSRRRAFVHTLERFHKDPQSKVVPYFVFGDFNFRCDTEGVVRQLTEDLTMHRVQSAKNDNSKVQYRNSEGSNVLTVGKKEFTHCDQSKFKENWLRQFDKELETLKDIIYEYPVTFPPSYPYEEEPSLPHHYMKTRCPAWCDRILISKAAKKLINGNQFCDEDKLSAVTGNYGVIGENVCMGDHKGQKSVNPQRNISCSGCRRKWKCQIVISQKPDTYKLNPTIYSKLQTCHQLFSKKLPFKKNMKKLRSKNKITHIQRKFHLIQKLAQSVGIHQITHYTIINKHINVIAENNLV